MAPLTAFALCISCIAVLVTAIPTFEHLSGWDLSFGSFVPGASYIQAIGRQDLSRRSRHLNVHIPGFPGNLTATPDTRATELFYIHQNQLWQMVNETTIYAVNLKNITGTPEWPLQLISSRKREGNRNGVWKWRGTLLVYEEGKMSNGGLFYECEIKDGLPGIFTFLKGTKRPDGCSPMTLHGMNRLTKLLADQSQGR